MMKQGLIAFLILSATPALAHHEAVVVASMVPLYSALVAIFGAAIAAWTRRRMK